MREKLIAHILRMKNGTNMTTPQPEYASAAAEFYRNLLPDWSLGRGLREAMQKQEKGAEIGRD